MAKKGTHINNVILRTVVILFWKYTVLFSALFLPCVHMIKVRLFFYNNIFYKNIGAKRINPRLKF